MSPDILHETPYIKCESRFSLIKNCSTGCNFSNLPTLSFNANVPISVTTFVVDIYICIVNYHIFQRKSAVRHHQSSSN